MINNKSISVIIITYNAQNKISRCLESLPAWIDEIVVVDSFSDDKTVEICRKYTEKIYRLEFTNFAESKNFALSLAIGEWVLSVDADEEISPELSERMKMVLSVDGKISGYYIKRKSLIFGRWFKFSGTQNDYPMRLFKKLQARFYQPIHELVAVEGSVQRIHEPLLHYTYDNINDYTERMNKYTSMEADFLRYKKLKIGFYILCFKPVWRFLDMYIIKQGFNDGVEGFMFCTLSAFYEFIKHVKCIAIFQRKI